MSETRNDFWTLVAELANMRNNTPEERRTLSGIRHMFQQENTMNTTYDFQNGNGPVPAHRHKNPDGSEGGWVAETAYVDDTAHVDHNAVVYGDGYVKDRARILDFARVSATVMDDAVVSGHATVIGEAEVYGRSCVGDSAVIRDWATVKGSACVKAAVIVSGNSIIAGNTSLDGHRIIRDQVLSGSETEKPRAESKTLKENADLRTRVSALEDDLKCLTIQHMQLTQTIADALESLGLQIEKIREKGIV